MRRRLILYDTKKIMFLYIKSDFNISISEQLSKILFFVSQWKISRQLLHNLFISLMLYVSYIADQKFWEKVNKY
jgi:hypothetical protein